MSNYLQQYSERFMDELKDFLKIQSISADSQFKSEIDKAANYLVNALKKIGLDDVQLFQTEGNPIVFAEKMTNSVLPTVLIYGHYDVQPADPLELWDTPPFEPQIRNGKIYARGACDDKSQVHLIIKTMEILNLKGDWPCNIKVIFEGEEEIGSLSMEKFVDENLHLLEADTLLVCDTAMPDENSPSLICGLRGISYFEIEVSGANKDLHSGMVGGAIMNPLVELVQLLSKLKDEQQHILIPGFYDDTIEPSEEVKKIINKNTSTTLTFNEDLFDHSYHIPGRTLAEQITLLPTLDIHGISGGYTGEGPKTIIPTKASAKISMRLAHGQDHKKIANLFEAYLSNIKSSQMELKMKQLAGCNAINFSSHNLSNRAAMYALEQVFENKPLINYIGGSIPPVSILSEKLQLDVVLMGFGLDSDNIHSPNESFLISNYFKGIETLLSFFEKYNELYTKNKSKIN